MLTERECWDRIDKMVGLITLNDCAVPPSTAEVEKLEVYIKTILIGRRVEALEE